MGLVLFICLAYFIDYGCRYLDLGIEFPIVLPLCTYICLTELVSIIENIIKLNPELNGSKITSFFKSSETPEDLTTKKN